jgi:uncharacterized protein YndB with AHSA1/START domain
MDIAHQIDAIHRKVGRQPGAEGDVISVELRRSYDASIDDVWNALTEPDRLQRWFYPVSGDLRPGGNFQLEGNAGGEILECAPPRLLKVTFGGATSVVQLRLSSQDDGGTALEFEHTVPVEMAGSGAGALYVGPGWDGALTSLHLYLHGEVADDPAAAANSPEGQELGRQSIAAWVAVITASGTASDDEIAGANAAAMQQFAPDLAGTPSPEGSDK